MRIDIDSEEDEDGGFEEAVREPRDDEGAQHDNAGAETAVLAPHEATAVDDTGRPQAMAHLAVQNRHSDEDAAVVTDATVNAVKSAISNALSVRASGEREGPQMARSMFLRLPGREFQDVGPTRNGRLPYVARLTRGSPVRHDQPSVGDGSQERWTRVGRVSTDIQAPCCVDTYEHTL